MNLLRLIPPPIRNPYLKWALFFCLSLFMLLWLSNDSYLVHSCTYREDSAWFFTAGKAWMEGMTPYVDFADSKGPLLWLIYGIGYLITPTSFIGVFWLTVISYTFTFAFLWRTARMFVERRAALLVLATMPCFLFLKIHHDEVRAEDFCMPFVCIGIYCACRVLKDSFSVPQIRKCAFGLGAAMACCLLIKWNMFVMMGGMALIVAGVSIANKRADGVLFGLLGIAVVVLPFMLYFICNGNFDALIQEYFVTTFLITGNGANPGTWHTLIYTLDKDISSVYNLVELLGVIVGICLFCRKFRMSYWSLLSYIPFCLFMMFKPSWYYYYIIIMPFFIFLVIYVANACSSLLNKMRRWQYFGVVTVVYFFAIGSNVLVGRLVFFPSEDESEWLAIQNVVAKKHNARIIVSKDLGYGLYSQALPGCKYWALQSGVTPEMKAERYHAIRKRKADFVIIPNRENVEENEPHFFSLLQQCGYHQCVAPVVENGKTVMKALPVWAKE